MKSILFGNGINLTVTGFPCWTDLLNGIRGNIDTISTTNTLQYEYIYGQAMDGKWFEKGKKTPEFQLKEEIVNKLRENRWVDAAINNPIYQALIELNVDHYMTTNYEGYLLDLFGKDSVNKPTVTNEKLYSIRRRYDINGGEKHYWPIHGEVNYPKTIMLGMDQYGGYLGKIDLFVKGNYDHMQQLPKGGKEKNNIAARLRNGLVTPFSWIDLFFISDIHILGLSLGYDEIDLWWLLTYRKRQILNETNITNRIVFYDASTSMEEKTKKEGKHKMLKALGVDVVEKMIKEEDYTPFYLDILNSIQKDGNVFVK